METWKFFDITHREHILCNPMSVDKFSHVVDLLRLTAASTVLELATGKGEFILQLAETYGASGTGVDLSPYCVADAEAKRRERVPGSNIGFIVADGAAYAAEVGQSYDVTACIGASWIFDGHEGTLRALMGLTKPGGLIVVGEPYWMQTPDPAYLQAVELQPNSFRSHAGNVQTGIALGLILEYTTVSSHDEWDVYEALQWYASERYAREHPEDPDAAELLLRVRRSRDHYLQWGRDTVGWAIYVFRRD